ncbi:adenylosuccinate lyase [Porphyromonas levii]|uniref:adenylosuccinate lyase n=1 Tax=Porphyromonas levii TaxID=28114 RepID=UPI00039DEA69|nr:adenylosuccinate lyase [Porphyromonas levii]MBR8703406.1 Adenylosuccinate lyase [Porphyromonas levii]MBR8712622.1 Adenylosuccinate lyase [Porphyromonas levii]MBR8714614.1 Adenylosuccinate lyase [Porphyromonas levii]MBR8727105.1 Adenylosuccinate lyase [Porphyromonas levii]MBR8730008.1 Adenylosuccinate lyase [Porphyromonas levii]
MNTLKAISPIDGRYRRQITTLENYFSEYALMKYRVMVEVEYLLALSEELPDRLSLLQNEEIQRELKGLYENFSEEDGQRVKEIEGVTNHDVKAIEYFIKERLDHDKYTKVLEFVHFGLTSQDINNTAQPLMLHDALEEVWLPALEEIINEIEAKAEEWRDIPMLARTHGQPASPTTLGKELYVFVYRLKEQVKLFKMVPQSVKFGGATGNMNAHHIAYPNIDWRTFAENFAEEHLGLELELYTTQISNYDNLAALFDAIKRISVILIDFSRDIWSYVSSEYFKQKIKAGEVGSSAMPHKVNPIDFENAEGNLGIAIAYLEHLGHKLPISRLQRDLTDSTVLRNMGMPIAHMMIALNSLKKGLGKLLLHEESILSDLDKALPVVAEALQTILRREGYPNPYEALKGLTRSNEVLTREKLNAFIDGLDISNELKVEMKQITPRNYTGVYSK